VSPASLRSLWHLLQRADGELADGGSESCDGCLVSCGGDGQVSNGVGSFMLYAGSGGAGQLETDV
jgi:hypothetical protein